MFALLHLLWALQCVWGTSGIYSVGRAIGVSERLQLLFGGTNVEPCPFGVDIGNAQEQVCSVAIFLDGTAAARHTSSFGTPTARIRLASFVSELMVRFPLSFKCTFVLTYVSRWPQHEAAVVVAVAL